MIQKAVRNLVLGQGYYVESYSDFKTILLSGWYALFCIGASLVYLALDIVHESYLSSALFLSFIIVFTSTLYLHRKRKHRMANSILFPAIALAIFTFASSESPATGAMMFFPVVTLGAFTIYGLDQRREAYAFLGLACLLFWLSFYARLSPLPYRHYDQVTQLIYLTINFIVAILAVVLVATLLVRLHHHNSQKINEQNTALRKANAELDQFVYSASHDLRAPLSSVLGLITLAERSSQTEAQHYLSLMKQRIHTLENFIQDVTDFSRNSRLDVDRKKISVAALTLDVWEGLRFIDGADAIRFKMDIKSDLVISTDPSRLRIVLGNLLSNAIRYHHLHRVDPFIRVAATLHDQVLVLEVEDNGQGIDPAYVNRIFEMFYRANENSKGTGLGLFIVTEVLKKVQGAIDVESTLGKGTLFRVTIPC